LRQTGFLLFEDGICFKGVGVGRPGVYCGEAVFNTAASGYLEIFSDPSYAGQIVVMTSPHIGNYGISTQDAESEKGYPGAIVIRELCRHGSNFRMEVELNDWLNSNGIPALVGVDTRAITRFIRQAGSMRSVVCIGDVALEEANRILSGSPRMEGSEWVSKVSCDRSYEWSEPLSEEFFGKPERSLQTKPIVVYDFGVKRNTLRHLVHRGFRVVVVPWDTSSEWVSSYNPSGILLSNGPGDPATLPTVVNEIQKLLSQLPIFGICLGHQLLGRALGATTFKLPFGHHGANHPVRDLTTGRIEITSQNHGFAVDPSSLPDTAEITHWNLYDSTLEGFQVHSKNAFAVQFHPEAAPGPRDSNHLFDRFQQLIQQ